MNYEQKAKRTMNKIKKGDKVKVLLGKDNGKQGSVERVLTKKNLAFVAGVNMYKRHVKKQGSVEGGIIEIIKPVNISNLALICPNCQKPTRVKFKIIDGKKLRVCIKCQKEII